MVDPGEMGWYLSYVGISNGTDSYSEIMIRFFSRVAQLFYMQKHKMGEVHGSHVHDEGVWYNPNKGDSLAMLLCYAQLALFQCEWLHVKEHWPSLNSCYAATHLNWLRSY